MFEELSIVMEKVNPNAGADVYGAAIVDDNILGKPTQTTRQRSAKRLSELYATDPSCTVFRLLRHFWNADSAGRPMLAFLVAVARDPLLRDMTPTILLEPSGQDVNAREIAVWLREKFPGRYRDTTLKSTSQNLASTWTQAGILTGKIKKQRARPVVTPVVAAFAVLLGYLCGLRGKMLLDSLWTRMLDRPSSDVTDLVAEASRQGWLNYKAAGSVVEITFPGLLRSQEERAAYEQD
ncbi:hypothetical protein HOV93_12290 [Planctomycetes bacterium FF15]|uniref:Uncharacterized protein n=2 Tax=Bremerella alba TaxID=980252 RepID=A0A7V8V360_9BACT|nr:hypothetical protein [Bremerella alba]